MVLPVSVSRGPAASHRAVKTCRDLGTVGGLSRESANRITEEVKGRARLR